MNRKHKRQDSLDQMNKTKTLMRYVDKICITFIGQNLNQNPETV